MFSNLHSDRSFMKISGLLPHKIFVFSLLASCAFGISDVQAADEQEQIENVAAEQTDIPKSMQRKARRKSNASVIFVESKVDEVIKRANAAAEAKTEEVAEAAPEEAQEGGAEVEEVEEKLSEETASLLESIPAGGMPEVRAVVSPKKSVSIKRGGSANPFGDAQDVGDIVAGESGLNISIKEPETSEGDYLRIASDAMKAGQTESAIAYYKKVLMQDQNNEKAKFGLATTYHRSGQLEQARDMYIELISMDQNNWPALNNFLILASEEAPEDALSHLKRLQESNPEFAGIPAQISMIYMKQNKLKDAARYLGKAVALDPENLHYQYDLALLLENMGYNDMASKLYKRLLDAYREGKELPESYMKISERFAVSSAK